MTKQEEAGDHDIDDEADDGLMSSAEEGTKVAWGRHIVPAGVVVEKLKSKAKLRDECSDELHKLLTEKELFDVYDKFIGALVDDKTTRDLVGNWKEEPIVGILGQFQDKFASKGVKVALCKRKSGNGTFRWFEYIDEQALEAPYVPQYDVANLSGQVIKTMYTKIRFPNGVAAEELKQWSGRQKLKEKCPIYVEEMLEKHDLMAEYHQLVDHVVESGIGDKTKMWSIEKLKLILDEYKPMFSKKGVDLFICHKQEWVSHGSYGGHNEYFRWIEFVDRSLQPSYQPQRDAEEKSEKCSIM